MLPRDIGIVLRREMTHRYRQPTWLIMGLAQPILYMFFFGPLLKKFVAHTPGFPPGGTWNVFAPALILQMVIIGSSFAGLSLLAEYRSGVFDRFRVTPMRPTALLLGKVLNVAVNVMIQAGIIVLVCHFAFHVSPPPKGLAVCLLMSALLSIAIASCSYALALKIKSEEVLPAVLNALLMPMFLLSGTLLPITTQLAPTWLWELSRLNPVAHVMEATRAGFRGDYSSPSLTAGAIALAVMTPLSVRWAIRTFSQQSA